VFGSEFEIISEISDVEIIARGHGVRARSYLNRTYGRGRWRKLKGITLVKLDNGEIWLAEIHWYEAHGIGRKNFKIKRKIERKP
jgi:hypothetical protein